MVVLVAACSLLGNSCLGTDTARVYKINSQQPFSLIANSLYDNLTDQVFFYHRIQLNRRCSITGSHTRTRSLQVCPRFDRNGGQSKGNNPLTNATVAFYPIMQCFQKNNWLTDVAWQTPDDAVSNLGSSVGGIHSEQRVRCKCPQANKSTISYAVVNNNGWPSHMIYQSYFQGEARYFIFECFCIHPNPKRPFGRRGNDFLEDAKKHLRAINHRDIVKEHRQFLQSQHIRVPPDYFVIEELGRLVRGCSAALANENNRQFCVDRFNHQNKTNLEKYCFYECESTRSGVPSPATAPPVALEHPEHGTSVEHFAT